MGAAASAARSRATALASSAAATAVRAGGDAAAPLASPRAPLPAPPPPPPPAAPPAAAAGDDDGGGGGGGGGSTVSVTRLFSSGPPVADAAALHARDPAHVTNALRLDGTVEQSPLMDGTQVESVALYAEMQRNPALLDTPAALSRSSTAQAALRVLLHARGGPSPPGAQMAAGAPGAPPLLLPAGEAQHYKQACNPAHTRTAHMICTLPVAALFVWYFCSYVCTVFLLLEHEPSHTP